MSKKNLRNNVKRKNFAFYNREFRNKQTNMAAGLTGCMQSRDWNFNYSKNLNLIK